MKRLFVVKEAGVGGRVHMIIGPTDFQDAWKTLYEAGPCMAYYGNFMKGKILCADDMSGPSALETQRL